MEDILSNENLLAKTKASFIKEDDHVKDGIREDEVRFTACAVAYRQHQGAIDDAIETIMLDIFADIALHAPPEVIPALRLSMSDQAELQERFRGYVALHDKKLKEAQERNERVPKPEAEPEEPEPEEEGDMSSM